jgi:hypothetical protein
MSKITCSDVKNRVFEVQQIDFDALVHFKNEKTPSFFFYSGGFRPKDQRLVRDPWKKTRTVFWGTISFSYIPYQTLVFLMNFTHGKKRPLYPPPWIENGHV